MTDTSPQILGSIHVRESDNGNLTFTVVQRTRPPGRTQVLQAADCPGCGRRLKVGGWGYPRPESGDLRLHCMRCVRPTVTSRRDLADGRRQASGLPRNVTRAERTGACASCEHPILPGHLIENTHEGGHRHVKCPSLCVRCEMPIVPGQRFSERMAVANKTAFGWKHVRCHYDDLTAKRARDAAANADRQRRAAEVAREHSRGRGRQHRD